MTPPPEPTDYLRGRPWWIKLAAWAGWWPSREKTLRQQRANEEKNK